MESRVVHLVALDRPEEVGDTQVRLLGLAGEPEPRDLRAPLLIRPDHQFIAVAIGREVAVDHLRHEEVVGAHLGQLAFEDEANPLLELTIVLVELGAELPLVAEQRREVEERDYVVDGDPLDHPAPEEGRLEDLVVGHHFGGPPWCGRRFEGVEPGRPRGLRKRGGLSGHDAGHGVEPGERVLAVVQGAGIAAAKVGLDVIAGQRRAPKEDGRVPQPPSRQLVQVVLHDQRALHEQTAHPDGVRLVLLVGADQLGDPDLDAQVVDGVAVVPEDDVDQVLADVVDVPGHRGDDDRPPVGGVGPLHQRLEMRHGLLHRLGRLEHEGQLHLAAGEQLPHDLHPREQVVVDDVEGLPAFGQSQVEVLDHVGLVSVDDAAGQTLPE